MSERGGRAGWTYGGLGSLLWILILGTVVAAKGHPGKAALCFAFFGAGVAYLVIFAPWKHRATPLWKSFLGFVALLGAAGVAVFFAVHEVVPGEEQLNPWMLLLLAPMCFPIFGFGTKTWDELHGRE